MASNAFVNDARVMAKGQITIPKNVRTVLGLFSEEDVENWITQSRRKENIV